MTHQKVFEVIEVWEVTDGGAIVGGLAFADIKLGDVLLSGTDEGKTSFTVVEITFYGHAIDRIERGDQSSLTLESDDPQRLFKGQYLYVGS